MKLVIALSAVLLLSFTTGDEPKFKLEHTQQQWTEQYNNLAISHQRLQHAIDYLDKSNLPRQESQTLINELKGVQGVIDSAYFDVARQLPPQIAAQAHSDSVSKGLIHK